MEYRFVPTDLRRVADISLNKIRLLADAKTGSLLLVEAPVNVIGSGPMRTRIEQVLDNVLSNALKYSPEGQPSKLQMTPQCEEGLLHVDVSDSGPGMGRQRKSTISLSGFIRAAQDEASSVGSGLGLLSCEKGCGSPQWTNLGESGKWERNNRAVYPVLDETWDVGLVRSLRDKGILLLLGTLSACSTVPPPLCTVRISQGKGRWRKLSQVLIM